MDCAVQLLDSSLQSRPVAGCSSVALQHASSPQRLRCSTCGRGGPAQLQADVSPRPLPQQACALLALDVAGSSVSTLNCCTILRCIEGMAISAKSAEHQADYHPIPLLQQH